MRYGICTLSVIPCRRTPSDKIEMVTQLLFGECCTILDSDKTKKWLLVRTSFDNYECWVDVKQLKEISHETFSDITNTTEVCTADAVSVIKTPNDNCDLLILRGSPLPLYNKGKGKIEQTIYDFRKIGHVETRYVEMRHASSLHTLFGLKNHSQSDITTSLIKHGYSYLGTPYLWGGRTPLGIDCSGFIQMLFRLCGIKLPRDAEQQAEVGTTVDFIEQSSEGDLAFFSNEKGKIVHVGLILSGKKIIHASGAVRIDPLDHEGIYNFTTQTYTHRLRLIKRIVTLQQ